MKLSKGEGGGKLAAKETTGWRVLFPAASGLAWVRFE